MVMTITFFNTLQKHILFHDRLQLTLFDKYYTHIRALATTFKGQPNLQALN